MAASGQNGMIGGVDTTMTKAMIDSAFTAIAWYNVIELNVIIWMTFKRRKGLYFYSLLVSSWGIFIYALASMMKFYRVWQNDYVSVSFITIGWYAMVTGQSLVQYSRLHLVVHDSHKIRWVLYMIIINAFLFHVPTTIMTYGVNSPLVSLFITPYSIMEKVQITAFTIQESIISSLYVYKTQKILRPTFQRNRTRRVMLHLIIVNLLVILLDLTLLCTEYANQYEIETTYKGALYSVKLRLEFAVLSQLVSLIRPDQASPEHQNHTHNGDVHVHHNPTPGHGRAGMPMGTMRHGRAADGPKQDALACATATCFAGVAGGGSPFGDALADKGVVMTTEIAIDHELMVRPSVEEKAELGLGRGRGVEHRERARDGGGNVSPASSQVEFAGAGY